jgi:hypothetical protein
MVLEQGTGEIWGGEPEATTAAAPVIPNEANKPIADFVFNAQNRAEDIALFEVDDDNEPAPENIPAPDAALFRLGGGSQQRAGVGMGWDRPAGHARGSNVQRAFVRRRMDCPAEDVRGDLPPPLPPRILHERHRRGNEQRTRRGQ